MFLGRAMQNRRIALVGLKYESANPKQIAYQRIEPMRGSAFMLAAYSVGCGSLLRMAHPRRFMGALYED